MNKSMQTLLSELRKNNANIATVVTYLNQDDNVDNYGLEMFMNLLSEYKEPNLTSDMTKHLISIIEVAMDEEVEIKENKINEIITNNSYRHYHEIFTTQSDFKSDQSIIRDYGDRKEESTLDYSVFAPTLRDFYFVVGNLNFTVKSIDEISVQKRDGTTLNVSYKYQITVRHGTDSIYIHNEFNKFKIDVLYYILGMSFLIDNETSKIEEMEDRFVVTVDSYPYYSDMAKKYNSYFTNLKTIEGTNFSDLKGIEKCYFDSNGLILVPRLFVMSQNITDCDIGDRPFIWDDNKGDNRVDLNQNQYRITIIYPSSVTARDAEDTLNLFFNELAKYGIILKMDQNPKKNLNTTTLSCKIEGYDKNFTTEYTNTLTRRSYYERKLSDGLRELVRNGKIGFQDLRSTSITAGTEKYIFVRNSTKDSIESTYSYNDSKFKIFFNHSSYTINNSKVEDSSDLTGIINDLNNDKFNFSGEMKSNFSKKNLVFNGIEYQDKFSNYLPISFIIIPISRGDVEYNGISFIPFGFCKYVDTDVNAVLNLSGFSIRGSEFSFTPTVVQRVIKLTNTLTDIPNIIQVVIRLDEEPIFDKNMDQPLKVKRIDDFHYIALLRSSAKNFKILNGDWFYASDYVFNSEDYSEDTGSSMIRTNFKFDNLDIFSCTKSSILRFYIETIAYNSNFKESIIENFNMIFQGDTLVSLIDLFTLYSDEEIVINGVPSYFFRYICESLKNGVPSDSILDVIYKIVTTRESDSDVLNITGNTFNLTRFDECFDMIKFFIKSVQNSIKVIDTPVFTNDMQVSISKKFLLDLEKATDSIYMLNSEFVNKSKDEILIFLSNQSGILRVIISMIIDLMDDGSVMTTSTFNENRNNIIQELKTIGETLILPEYVGMQISTTIVQLAASTMLPELFCSLVDEIYKSISTDSYEFIINELFDAFYNDDENIVISQVSESDYVVTFNSEYEQSVHNLNNSYISRINKNLTIQSNMNNTLKLGEFKYDPNIHCMFSVEHSKNENQKNVIMDAFSNIYYSTIGDVHYIKDLHNVSIYHSEDDFETGTFSKFRFFIPYNSSNGRLTIDSCNWTEGESSYKLESNICEIEFDFDINHNTTLGVDIDIDHKSKMMFLKNTLSIREHSEDVSFMKSVLLGLEPIEKTFTDRRYHFAFTKDLDENLSSVQYDMLDNDNFVQTTEDNTLDKISVTIYPSNNLIPKLMFARHTHIIENYKFFAENMITLRSLSVRNITKFTDTYNTDYNSYFDETFETFSKNSDEVMVITNSSGIYTKYYGSKLIENVVGSNENDFTNYSNDVDFKGMDELTNLDSLILTEKINLENDSIKNDNKFHNLSLAMGNIKWNLIKVNNYRFYSSDKPKWIKLSKDSNFIGIGFQSGVKIYIKSGNRYIFCVNLNHESVSDIIFGDKSFCVTKQYDDSTREFAHLWVTAAGFKVDIKLPFYDPIAGDAVNIKYINDKTNKSKHDVLLEYNSDGKMSFGKYLVQYAEPIFDHNSFFFSQDDKYLIYNRGGRPRFFDIENMRYVTFTHLNGISIDRGTNYPKCIKNGEWVNSDVFVGFTYASDRIRLKMKIIVNFSNLSIILTPVISEYPERTIYKNMITESSGKEHHLYSYLMNYKEKFSGNNRDGLWVHDCFISFETISGVPNFRIQNLDGKYQMTEINISPDNSQSITQFIYSIMGIFEYNIVDNKIKQISWLNTQLFDVNNSNELSTSQVYTVENLSNGKTDLQYVDDNFFTFIGSAIYVWNYNNNSTELIHIDVDGYEKFIFDGKIAVVITDQINVACIVDGFINMKTMNIDNIVNFKNDDVKTTKIIKPISETIEDSIIAYTETTVENYSNDAVFQINVDSKPISSSLCLNRAIEYKLRSHFLSSNDNVVSHGNLLVITKGNEVTILPKTIQVNSELDGFNNSWYKKQDDDNWLSKKNFLLSYINESKIMFPQFLIENVVRFDSGAISRIFKFRTSETLEDGFLELINEEFSPEVIYALRRIHEVFGSITSMFSLSFVSNTIRDYENNNIKSENKVNAFVNSLNDDDRRSKYDEFIYSIRPLFGDQFYRYNAIHAFRMISGIYRQNIRRIDDIRTYINSQHAENEDFVDIVRYVNHIINFPLTIKESNINKPGNYRNSFNLIYVEINKINIMMSNVSKYDLYRSPEIGTLIKKYKLYMKYSIGTNLFLSHTQTLPDYIISLKPDIEELSSLPIGVTLKDGIASDGENHYSEISNGNFVKMSDETKNVLDAKSISSFYIDMLKGYILSTVPEKLGENNVVNTNNILTMIKKDVNDENKVHHDMINSFIKYELLVPQQNLSSGENITDLEFNKYINSITEGLSRGVIDNDEEEEYDDDIMRNLDEFYKNVGYSTDTDDINYQVMNIKLSEMSNKNKSYRDDLRLFIKKNDLKINPFKYQNEIKIFENDIKKKVDRYESVNPYDILNVIILGLGSRSKQYRDKVKMFINRNRLTLDEENYHKEIKMFNDDIKNKTFETYIDTLIKDSNYSTTELNIGNKVVISYFESIVKYSKKEMSIIDIFTMLTEINDIRFPSRSLFSDSYINEIVSTYDDTLPDDFDVNILIWNKNHINKTFSMTKSYLNRKNYVSDGYYTEDYENIRKKFVPMIWKYRNGVSDQSQVPVTSIKLIFSHDVKCVDKHVYNQSETDDIEFEYSIDEDDVKYGIKTGIVKVNLIDIINKFTDRSSDVNTFDIDRHYENIIENLEYYDEFNLTMKLLPKIDISVDNFDDLKRSFITTFKNVQLGVKSNNNLLNEYVKSSQFAISDIIIDYTFDYTKSGVDFGYGHEFSMIYSNKQNGFNLQSFDYSKNIAIDNFKSIDFEPRLVKVNGDAFILDRDSNKYIVWYGNTMVGDNKTGAIILQDIMTREITIYNYIMTHAKRWSRTIPTYIKNIQFIKGKFVIVEDKTIDKYVKGKGFVDTIVERREYYDNFEKFLFGSSVIGVDPNKRTVPNFIPVEKINKSIYELSNIDDANIKSYKNRYVIVNKYRNDIHYGSNVEVYEFKNDKTTLIHSWNFNSFNIMDFDINDENLIVIGRINSSNGVNAKIGMMNLNNDYSNKSVFVKVFDREIILSNPNVENLSNCTVNAGKITYISYMSKNMSHLVIINNKIHYESFNVYTVDSMKVSKECGYVSLYYKSRDESQIWNSNGKLHDTISGECNWM